LASSHARQVQSRAVDILRAALATLPSGGGEAGEAGEARLFVHTFSGNGSMMYSGIVHVLNDPRYADECRCS